MPCAGTNEMYEFYILGGIIGVLLNLRFMVPLAINDIGMGWGLGGKVKTLFYHLVRIIIFSCVCFFVSWISVGFIVYNYGKFKDQLDFM